LKVTLRVPSRPLWFVKSCIFSATLVVLTAVLCAQEPPKQIPLPTSKILISPSPGRIARTNSFPATVAISPDKHYAAFLNDGYGTQASALHQSIAILDKDPSYEFAIAKPAGQFLHGAHELAAHAVTSERPAHVNVNFTDVIQRNAHVVGGKRNPAGNPISHVRPQDRMLGIIPGAGSQQSLIHHRTRLAIKGLQVLLHSFIKKFAQRRGVLLSCGTYLQLRSRGYGGHKA